MAHLEVVSQLSMMFQTRDNNSRHPPLPAHRQPARTPLVMVRMVDVVCHLCMLI
jgi:hypothetical protein